MKKFGSKGPSPNEIKQRGELDRLRRELSRLKKGMELEDDAAVDAAPEPATNGAAPHDAAPAGAPAHAHDPEREVQELRLAKERLSRLYTTQLRENQKRAQKLHQILESVRQLNSGFDLDTMLACLAENIRANLGFRVVLIRLREPGSRVLRTSASAGLDAISRARLSQNDLPLDTFLSWLRDEFRVSRSYFISHRHELSREVPKGHVTPLGPRADWEWHEDDVLLVPLFNREDELVGYFSVDDPEDRLAPSREVVELLEIYANHAVVAIVNARLYGQLQRHSQDLEQAGQHMQELHALKSNFVSAVSHELRTPLTAIKAYTETLLHAAPGEVPQEQVRRFLSIIDEESQRLGRLIESVLDLNRSDSGNAHLTRQTFDMHELLVETIAVLQPVAQVGQVQLALAIDPAMDTKVEANRDQIRQLALHLGGNAVKFTPPGGSVTLRLDDDGEGQLRLCVEDTGIGIPQDALEKVFERFYQVDSSLARRYGGTGLGLAICKSVVDWHGGRIFVESEQGRGSCFTVLLPRKPAQRVALRPNHRRQAATEDVLRLAMEMVAEVMGARVVSLLTPDPDGDLVIRAAIGLDEDVVREARVRPGAGVAGWVAEHRRPVCVSGNESPQDAEAEATGRTQYRSGTFLSVPLESADGLLGVLNVTEPVGQKTFDAEDCHLLLHLAQRVAAAWEQALVVEKQQVNVDMTAESLREVLRHLESGRRHSPDRVTLARGTARHLGLSESEVGVVSFAASVHDVGMQRIGERVVDGAGSLSAADREAIERHPELGVEVLQPLETVGVVRDIVLSHHEWFDGTGYPRGLAGDAIPIGARILAAVDAYESMTVGRAHRDAVSVEDAFEELNSLAGKQFDPVVVAALQKAVKERDETSDTRTEAQSGQPMRG